ncbi:MAG TPA: DnaJ domain-containing protein [Kofleriaceae bacterium]|nr:DnaJ domain-containing protein [Kofleriaceae bacterium]
MLQAVPSSRSALARGELVRLLYQLGHKAASGVLTISSRADEVFVLRRGHIVAPEGEAAKKLLVSRLARLVALDAVSVVFESGIAAYPPGATNQISLTGWARHHLEAQLDGTLAEVMVRQLAGARLALRADLAPAPTDEADRRMLAAMDQPRRLDQIWPLARTPRFRLLAFLHFLRSVDALEMLGVVAEKSAPHRIVDGRRRVALATLGIDDDADLETVKRAYRRLARELHPDLQPDADAQRRRTLERRFAEVTAAYEALI